MRLGSVRGRVAAGLVGLVVVAGSLVAIGVAPAGATTANDETSFRNAWTTAGTTEIDLQNDITFATPCTSTAVRSSTTALTVNGNGHTLTLCTNAVGGVLAQNSTGALTFQNITVTGGTATTGFGGAIDSNAAVTVTNSTFTHNNTAGIEGGAIAAVAVTVTNSTFTHNTAADGSGAIFAVGAVTVTNSTFTTNTVANGSGGAIGTGGALTVTNSTFTTNTATTGGGAIFSGVAVTVAYSTLTGNVSANGSAVASDTTIMSFGSVFVKPAGTGNLCFGTASSLGYNFANETANSCGLTQTGDSSLDANNPLLGALANNGGPTQTQLPQDGPSPLIDAIPNTACQTAPLASGIMIDQRGLPRPDSASPNCDIGAVEVQPPAPAPTAPTALVVTPAFTG
jgi:predicted outer membrane repeat protein